jgi:hypothetical protein
MKLLAVSRQHRMLVCRSEYIRPVPEWKNSFFGRTHHKLGILADRQDELCWICGTLAAVSGGG